MFDLTQKYVALIALQLAESWYRISHTIANSSLYRSLQDRLDSSSLASTEDIGDLWNANEELQYVV